MRTAVMLTPPHNLDAERSVLGALLLSDRPMNPLLVEDGLRPGHFYRDTHRHIFTAMVALHDKGEPVDAITVVGHLKADGNLEEIGGAGTVQRLVGDVEAPGNVRHYGRIVKGDALLRSILNAAYEIQAGVHERAGSPAELLTLAEQAVLRIGGDVPAGDSMTSTAAELGHMVFEYLEGRGDEFKPIPTPWQRLNDLLSGGLRRGDTTVIAGWSSMGKSVCADQILEWATFRGFKGHAYINEMARRERALRQVARQSGVPYKQLREHDHNPLASSDMSLVLGELDKLPFGITDITGWGAAEVCRHIRRHRPDIAVVDLVIKIPHRDVRDLDEISRMLNDVAISADCHMVLVTQLNQERAKEAIRPIPTGRDIRGTGMLFNDAANVLFVHRDQEETPLGVKFLPTCLLLLDKARNDERGEGVRVSFNEDRMRFERPAQPHLAEVA